MIGYQYVFPNGYGLASYTINLEWTQKMPTQEGWYWAIREVEGSEMRILFFDGEDIHHEHNSKIDYAYWLGPLPVPETPTP